MSPIAWFSRAAPRRPAADQGRPHAHDPRFAQHMIAELELQLAAVRSGEAPDSTLLEPVAALARAAQAHGFSDRLLDALDSSPSPTLHALAEVLAEHFHAPTNASPGQRFVARIADSLPAPRQTILAANDLGQLSAWLSRPVPRAWDAMRSLTAIQARTHATHGVTAAFVDAMDAACAPASPRLAVNVAVEACARGIHADPRRNDLLVAACSTIGVWFAAAELFNRGESTSAVDLVATHLQALRASKLPTTVAAGPIPVRLPHTDALAASGHAALARLRLARAAG